MGSHPRPATGPVRLAVFAAFRVCRCVASGRSGHRVGAYHRAGPSARPIGSPRLFDLLPRGRAQRSADIAQADRNDRVLRRRHQLPHLGRSGASTAGQKVRFASQGAAVSSQDRRHAGGGRRRADYRRPCSAARSRADRLARASDIRLRPGVGVGRADGSSDGLCRVGP